MPLIYRLLATSICLAACSSAFAAPWNADEFDKLLTEGKLTEAAKLADAELQANAGNDQARFALGVAQTLHGVEGLVQGLYRYGLQPTWASDLPFIRLPIPENPQPEALTNEAFRKLIADFAETLEKVEKTLAEVKSGDVKLLVRPGAYRIDFNADGTAADDESFWRVLARVTNQRLPADQAGKFVIAMDKADVHWLRGYCHFLVALCETLLAHDTQNLHDHAAQFFFPAAEVKYPFTPRSRSNRRPMWDSILDGIAFIHLLNLPVAEPQRMKTAHAHLLAMVDQSRASFAAIDAETDDDREWIPGPKQQQPAFQDARVSPEMVAGWHEVLKEWEAILKGEKLVPFWRGGTKGINVRRVFEEPTTFDLVLWVQGSAAVPYLEEGELTDANFWREVQRGFRGQFFWFAIWVN